MKPVSAPALAPAPASGNGAAPLTLAIDIGGSALKATIVDPVGRVVAERLRVATPQPAVPQALLSALGGMVAALPDFDRVSAGFPGVIRHGTVQTAPNLGTEHWKYFPLAETLSQRFGRPARVLNDADVQGLGIVKGVGVELVLTLGTGMGSSLFHDGRLCPHLELGQHPCHKGKNYDAYIGHAGLVEVGPVKWNKRLKRVIDQMRSLTNFDVLHLGGGNTKHVAIALPPDVVLDQNIAGLTGGARLWEPAMAGFFQPPAVRGAP